MVIRVSRKLKIGPGLVVKNKTIQKFDIHSDSFLTETACNRQMKLKVTKITLLAFIMHISNVLKHDQRKKIATDFRMQLYYLLVVAVVSDVKVTSLSTWLLVVDNFSIRT